MLFSNSPLNFVLSATLLLCFAAAACPPVRAQVAGGTLSGTISDPSGVGIPKAQVVVANLATGISRSVTTDDDGFYTVVNLLAGEYDVTITAIGFSTEIRKGVTISVGDRTPLDLALKVGEASKTTIVVTGEAPQVQLATSTISDVVNETTVRELPLNGRSWTDLTTLQAGTNAIVTQPSFATGSDRGNRGFGSQVTISGSRPQQNNYRLDGISVNDYANGSPGSVLGGTLGVDAIKEFSVLTSNYSAEYGKTSGGVINAITQSGTDSFHGSAYEFIRNSAVDAKNYFDLHNAPIPAFKRNQFGGTVSGPIIKKRTFFFADYEGIRQSLGVTSLNTVPSPAARAGLLCSVPQGPPNPCTPTQLPVGPNTDANGVDLSAKAYLTFFPVPNGPLIGNGDAGLFTFSGQQIINENFVTTRVDHKLTDSDNLFGTYIFDQAPYTSPDGFGNVLLTTKTSRQDFIAEETHIFTPAFANTVRFGFGHEKVANDQSLKALNPAAADPTLASMPGEIGAAQVSIAGITPFTGGIGGNPTYYYYWNAFQAYDDAFVNKGKHTIKFGFAFERDMLNVTALSNPTGVFKFGPLSSFDSSGNFIDSSFLQNIPKTFNAGLASTLTPRHLRQSIVGGYIQDDWRIRPHLTLNIGVRYEIATVPTETDGKLSNLPTLSAASPHLGSPYFQNPTLRNFDPRIGFAWDPFHNGKTAVRGGFGQFDVLPLLYQYTILSSLAAPFFELGSIHPPAGSFYQGVAPLLTANSLRATYIDPNPKRGYVLQYNLNVQQQLTSTLNGMIAYVGSRGLHEPFRTDDANVVLPTLTSAGYLYPNPVGSGNVINPNYGDIRAMFYDGRSYYDAMELQLTKRMSHGLQLQADYTWSKSIDTGSATVAGDTFANSISSLDWFNLKVDRGLSDFNVGHTFILNVIWQAPSPKLAFKAAEWAASGWQLGLIFKASDGVPFTPTFGTDGDPRGLNSSDPWDYPSRLTAPGCGTLTNPGNPSNYIKTQCFGIPTAPNQAFYTANCDPTQGNAALLQCFNLRGNAGRNILIGPGITNLDFSLFKNNYVRKISETFNVQFRAEIFNILNHPNFAPPANPTNTDVFNSSGAPNSAAGLLTSTTTTSRQIQLAIKAIF
jgi:Carboxypeptidase regulatory-like domain/TonB-dependent Receptor Plug Domain/TonB dependent receptor